MPTLFIDMPSGVAGDMLLAALLDLGCDRARLQEDLLALGVGPLQIMASRIHPNGISALRVEVDAEQTAAWDQRMLAASAQHAVPAHHHPPSPHHHHDHGPGHEHTHPHETVPVLSLRKDHAHVHRPYRVIRDLIVAAPLPERVKTRAARVFRLLAEAEAQVHGMAVDDITFHEVGSLDALADVVGCCLLLEQLDIDHVIATPILPGNGTVSCAHGRMPVPVPAVAVMLTRTGAPQRGIADETGELTTPTGCALVTGLADRWLQPGSELVFTSSRIGHGAGHKTIPGRTNIVRVSIIETAMVDHDTVSELRCQVDDATGEQLAHLIHELISSGARDAYLTPIQMKKGRPGYELTVLCDPGLQADLTALILLRSSTIGVRHQQLARTILPRRIDTVSIDGHDIALKVVTLPDGSERAKPEADHVLAVAHALGLSFDEIQRAALTAWQQRQ